jgi:ATP-dependent DNA helicase RecQ
VNAVAYHAGLAPERRARAQDAFMTGTTPVIVATNAFGMGIDKPDVRLVLHYLHSGSLEDYYQEAGRAGRDGARSNCLLLFNPADRQVHDRMREHGQVSSDVVRQVWQMLASLSAGRRAVPIDDQQLAARLGSPREAVASALALLEERGAFAEVSRPPVIRLRLLASTLRLECERAALSEQARSLLLQVAGLAGGVDEWRALAVSETGLSSYRLTEALGELESRQLLYVDPAPARAVVCSDSRSRAHVERLIHQRKLRREVERAKLNSMVGYATTLMCRRRFILNYFGDQLVPGKGCGDCDVCAPEK